MSQHCTLPCTSRRHLVSHHRYCSDNPDKVKTKNARAKADGSLRKDRLAYDYNGNEAAHAESEVNQVVAQDNEADFDAESNASIDAEIEDESEDESGDESDNESEEKINEGSEEESD
ncbi:hypothetical protein PI126_g7029 [Phytophthora idaei]|nr:hypothetical protein PI126_g7029 [Phytophthora idaei]